MKLCYLHDEFSANELPLIWQINVRNYMNVFG